MSETVRIKVGDKVTWQVRARFSSELLKAKVVEVEHIYKDGSVRVTGLGKGNNRFKTQWSWKRKGGDEVELLAWGAEGHGNTYGHIRPNTGQLQGELDAEIAENKAKRAVKLVEQQAKSDAYRQEVLGANAGRFDAESVLPDMRGDLLMVQLVDEKGHLQQVIFAVSERPALDFLADDEEYTEYVIKAQVYGRDGWSDRKRWWSVECKGQSVREALEKIAVTIWR